MLFLDGPTQLLRTAVGLPQRVVGLIDEAEDLLARARTSLASVETTTTQAAASIQRVSRMLDATEAVVQRTETLTKDATGTLSAARTLTQDAGAMVAQVQPEMQKVLPMLERFADRLSPAEVDAAIALVDELPALTRSLRDDVMPILGTLDRVGPDINELLHIMDDVRAAVLGIPGFAFFKKRGTEIIEEHPELDPHPHDDDVGRRNGVDLAAARRP
ncbi:MAG TPA: hypothetical protein VMZ00_16795 [Sporichthya sp.]|nr:hypothetical protein [Sporichthya sp.]